MTAVWYKGEINRRLYPPDTELGSGRISLGAR